MEFYTRCTYVTQKKDYYPSSAKQWPELLGEQKGARSDRAKYEQKPPVPLSNSDTCFHDGVT